IPFTPSCDGEKLSCILTVSAVGLYTSRRNASGERFSVFLRPNRRESFSSAIYVELFQLSFLVSLPISFPMALATGEPHSTSFSLRKTLFAGCSDKSPFASILVHFLTETSTP